ncbi:MAG: exo-beta-N-acetylmuramidase NamZ domain-containing protein, partial [Myxococcales bacterium]
MVKLGVTRLLDSPLLRGLRVGAILNPTSVDAELRHLADLLHQAKGVKLAALFGPEHGVRGDAQYLEEIGAAVDPRTRVPEHSLYGKDFASLTPRDEHLRALDALVFDVQDVGSRYYTYLATMGLALQAAKKRNLRFVVLDRPNPIGGAAVEGGVVHPGFESFV